MKIGIIRHGQTDWNLERRTQGSTDIPLNEKGRADAQLLAARVQKENWDLIVSSDLSRAAETAEIIAGAANIPHFTDPRLREVNFGQREGTTEEERVEKWGEDWRSLNLGRESTEDVLMRAMDALEELREQYPAKNILLVSHGAWITRVLRHLSPDGKLDLSATIHNTSITHISWDDDRWHTSLFNCTIHLPQS